MYSYREYYEMVRCYILSDKSLNDAQKMYEEEILPRLIKQGYKSAQVPHQQTIYVAHQNLLDHGQFPPPECSEELFRLTEFSQKLEQTSTIQNGICNRDTKRTEELLHNVSQYGWKLLTTAPVALLPYSEGTGGHCGPSKHRRRG